MGSFKANSGSFKKGNKPWNRKYETKEEVVKIQRQRALQNARDSRVRVLQYYSAPIPFCACCGEKEVKFLSIDHIEGGGTSHRKHLGKSEGKKGNIVLWIIRNNFPPGFQILCHNCNCAKGYYGACPHSVKFYDY